MVTQKEKKEAVQFVCDRLEDSGLYVILQRDSQHLVAAEKSGCPEKQPKTIDVVVANFLANIKDFTDRCSANRRNQIYTAPLLYKDGKTAFARVVDRNKLSWRTGKSFKEYTLQQINQMIHLRMIEKVVMGIFKETETLVYFQPETERLPISLREFLMGNVELDRSHLGPNDPAYGYAKDGPSVDYKLPVETTRIETAAKFSFKSCDPSFRAWIVPAALLIKDSFPAESAEFSAEEKARIDLTRMAFDAFPGLSSEEAYLALRPED